MIPSSFLMTQGFKWIVKAHGSYLLQIRRTAAKQRQVCGDTNEPWRLVHVENLEPLPKKFEATYLGNEINKEANIRHKILNKMQEVRQTWFKLLPYWKVTNANVKWQLLIFDAVVRSKLLYGLETIHLTDAMLKKLMPSNYGAWGKSSRLRQHL